MEPPRPTEEQVAAERARLQKILERPHPGGKPGARIVTWERGQERAAFELAKLNRGQWWPETEDDVYGDFKARNGYWGFGGDEADG